MKAKTLRRIDTKEFASLNEEFGMITHEHPYPLGNKVTIESLKNYCKKYNILDNSVDWNMYEIVEFEYYISGVMGADIRNKLSPPKNLVALLEIYFGDIDVAKKEGLLEIIHREMNQTEISIEYLKNLL